MEPIVTLMMTAIALGAASGLKPATERAVQDAYEGFKRLIIDRYNHHRGLVDAVKALGEKPDDIGRQARLETELLSSGAVKDPGLVEAANAVHIAGAAEGSRKKVLGRRLQRKLTQVEALENQADLTLDEGQKVILKEKVEALWIEIAELEMDLARNR